MCGVYEWHTWVGLTVLICTICRNVPEYLLLSRRIATSNGALRDLQNIQVGTAAIWRLESAERSQHMLPLRTLL